MCLVLQEPLSEYYTYRIRDYAGIRRSFILVSSSRAKVPLSNQDQIEPSPESTTGEEPRTCISMGNDTLDIDVAVASRTPELDQDEPPRSRNSQYGMVGGEKETRHTAEDGT